MEKIVGIGIQNFEKLITNHIFYIDKTHFIKEWWESGDEVTLIARPRRFEKTLNISMLEHFFIWQEEYYQKLQGTYPVISLSFANVKERDYKTTIYRISQLLMKQYEMYSFLKESDVLSDSEKMYFKKVINGLSEQDAPMVLHQLSDFEVKHMFYTIVQDWFTNQDASYNHFIKALFHNNIEEMNIYMNRLTHEVFSYFDVSKHSPNESERFYHGFVLGLITQLVGDYIVTSNRESGFGRYDIMLEATNKIQPSYIFEFKVYNSKKESCMEETVKNALKQIEEKQYETILLQRGIKKECIYKYGFAFDGKDVLIG